MKHNEPPLIIQPWFNKEYSNKLSLPDNNFEKIDINIGYGNEKYNNVNSSHYKFKKYEDIVCRNVKNNNESMIKSITTKYDNKIKKSEKNNKYMDK